MKTQKCYPDSHLPKEHHFDCRGMLRAETTTTKWVNCDALPSIPKPVRKYESSEDIDVDKSDASDLSSVASASVSSEATSSTRSKAKPPVPKRSYSVVERSSKK